MKNAFLFLAAVLLFSCSTKKYAEPHIMISTNYGDIEAELYPKQAPKTVAAFLSYIDSGLYRNTSFYRVLKADEMPTDYNSGVIQGGVFQTNPERTPTRGIIHESTKQSALFHKSGTLSLARTEPGTASTEFFICIGDQPQLDAGNTEGKDSLGYAAFGRVVEGMDVVRKIQAAKSHGESFDKKIMINNIERL
jgi:peptidyl-prolyl cis-trans isomerase A (cyclophilin A)